MPRPAPKLLSLPKLSVRADEHPLSLVVEIGAVIDIIEFCVDESGLAPLTNVGRLVKVMDEGEMDAGAWSCGMVAGLIRDVPTVKELIDRIMAEAEALIRRRLFGFLEGDAGPRTSIGSLPG